MRQELAIAAGAASIGAALWALRGRLRQKAKPADLEQWRVEFLDFCLECGVLLFGDFTLKSGRKCPFFFNAGNFKTGGQLARLGEYYAVAVAESKVPYDVLFGPAYKGIPLVAATAVASGSARAMRASVNVSSVIGAGLSSNAGLAEQRPPHRIQPTSIVVLPAAERRCFPEGRFLRARRRTWS